MIIENAAARGGRRTAASARTRPIRPGLIWVFAGDDGGRFPHMVLSALRGRGASVLHINYSSVSDLKFELADPTEPILEVDGERFSAPSCLWIRFKMQVGMAGIGTPDECLRIMEWSAVSRGLGALFEDVTLNGAARHLGAETKLVQLAHARRAGFETLDGCVTVGKGAVEAFLERSPQSVMKSLGYPVIPAPDQPDGRTPIVTTSIDSQQVRDAPPAAFQNNPLFVQARASGVEHRVVAFLDRHFLYRMDGRVEDRRIVDARIVGRRFTLLDPDPQLQGLCRAYLQSTGLNYGVFDLIRTADGAWVFLECNPEGQMVSAAGINLEEVADAFADLIEARAAGAVEAGCGEMTHA